MPEPFKDTYSLPRIDNTLDCLNYYQRFLKRYVQVAKPLYKLILGENASRK